ncbi:response regulator transcription factor [Liquorilactobacillus vini]|uniref:Response regulator protein GraR n=1 Tax=Liquorilactobacillus vini DSM 20605 TaxID=1133569 RepID=A0A0R2CGU9_9LACO|nr:response regulator transcription factor [Liquorilactobacillus vini]KRM87705.1 response regulator protein GraR [Liquorilactobacillus vini DSM 20605]
MKKIFLVEDDQALIQGLIKGLNKWNYQVITVDNWKIVAQEIIDQRPDLVIMDITLPLYDGFYWTAKLRELSQVPLIFLSAADMDPNAIRAIALGADDYLTKPFSVNVLLSKIQAVLRRTQLNPVAANNLQFENYQLNLLTNILATSKVQIKLTPTEGVILKLLFLNHGKIVTKTQIMNELWQGGAFVDENVLNVNLSRLRKKLMPTNLQQRIITERKRGYRLIEKNETE